jgi:NAD-dependent SIR2 family protein deacetylase
MVSMYCVKCRQKKDVDNATPVTMKNGKPAMEAKCPTCGTKMFRIGKAK